MGVMGPLGRVVAGRTATEAGRPAAGRPPVSAATPREGFVSRMANAAFAVNGWNDLFNRWFPSLELHAKVVVQGGPHTPNRVALHTALSIAFGTLQNRRLANVAMKVRVDHTLNRVEVGFGISTNALLDVTNVLGAFVSSDTARDAVIAGPLIAGAVVRGVTKPAQGGYKDNPGTVKRGQAAAPPVAPDGNGAGKNVAQAQRDVFDRINTEIGSAAAWDLSREEIRGGQAPACQQLPGQLPFEKMIGKVQLTRQPAANPQPPAALGFDLRTLVAQVLHDPGVRPPYPQTDRGPPVIANEVLGV